MVMSTITGPASYASGGFTSRVNSLRQVEKVISISNNGGIKSDAGDVTIGTGASRNLLTILARSFQYTCGASYVASEVDNGVNLSGITFTAIVIGT